MPNIGPAEIFVILVVALLVFGPDKLPEIGRQVGRAVREFRRVQHNLREEVREVLEPRTDTAVPPQLPAITSDPTFGDRDAERDADDDVGRAVPGTPADGTAATRDAEGATGTPEPPTG